MFTKEKNKNIFLISASIKPAMMKWGLALITIVSAGACKKLIDISSPISQLTNDKVFTDEKTITSVISGIYANLNVGGVASYPILTTSCAADELQDFTGSYTDFYNCSFKTDDPPIGNMWKGHYAVIYQTNDFLEKIQGATNISDAFRQQVIGESYFIRAFCYFELINIFGDVPLITTPDVKQNIATPRTSSDVIYKQIIADLKEAQSRLKDAYPSDEKSRANKVAATALLARVYLYNEKWQDAEDQASMVINNKQYFLHQELDSVFLSGSSETILQLWNQDGISTGSSFLPSSSPSFAFSAGFLNGYTPGDQRMNKWINTISYNTATYYYPNKYKLKTSGSSSKKEYLVMLRLGEQYLIRAEARINNNKIKDGIKDLNVVRERARMTPSDSIPDPVPDIRPDLSLAEAQLAVENERKRELFTEFGHRWFDLKRTGRVNAVMSKEKPMLWRAAASLYPIPLVEINANPTLVQNPGYN